MSECRCASVHVCVWWLVSVFHAGVLLLTPTADVQGVGCAEANDVVECGTTAATGIVADGLALADGVRYYVCIRVVSAVVREGACCWLWAFAGVEEEEEEECAMYGSGIISQQLSH
jgi:hypothetical protein